MNSAFFEPAFLKGLLVWFFICAFCGFLVGRYKESYWWGVIVTAVPFLLPVWDLPFGLYRYQQAVNSWGGTRVFQRVYADGYLNRKFASGFDVLSILHHTVFLRPPGVTDGESIAKYPYRFKEAQIVSADGGVLVPRPGLWRFTLASAGDLSCAAYDKWSQANSYRLPNELSGTCIVATAIDEPQSRYAHEFISPDKPKILPGPWWQPPVYLWGDQIVDLRTGAVIAQSYFLSYRSWMAIRDIETFLPFVWTAGAGPLKVTEVILPTDSLTSRK